MGTRVWISRNHADFLALGIEHMRRAGHTWIKGTDNLNDFERFVRNLDRRVLHCHFIGTIAGHVITRAGIPCRRYNALVVIRLTILDRDIV